MVKTMKFINGLWIIIFLFISVWIYYIFISPVLFYSNTILVPDVVGLNEEDAVRKLEDLDIGFKITYVEDESENVIKTLPYSGVSIKRDYIIDLFIGKKMPSRYPGFIGRIYDECILDIERICNDSNINIVILYEERNDVISGIIVKESINEGERLDQHNELILTISKNQDYFLMPNLVGMNINEAIKILKEYNISPIINYYSSPIDYDLVLYQSILKDSIVKKGNKYEVTLYVSKGMSIENVNVSEMEEMLVFLGYDVVIKYVKSNEESNKFVAFEVEKLYHRDVIRFILIVTE